MEEYQRFGAIKRTIFRRPVGLVDWQAVLPMGWCVDCGREIYGPGRELCDRCGKMIG